MHINNDNDNSNKLKYIFCKSTFLVNDQLAALL